jgi:curved DNA-binding protein CbpA
VRPDASSEEIGQAYLSKAGLLRPELISGAPPKVATAAAQARGILDAARRVLADPVNRQRYDEARRPPQRRLGPARGAPSQPGGGLSDYDVAVGNPGAEVLRSLMALNDWLDRHPGHQRRIPVPDVRGGCSATYSWR